MNARRFLAFVVALLIVGATCRPADGLAEGRRGC